MSMAGRSPRPFIPDALAARAADTLHAWSGASPEDRMRAREILRNYEAQENEARINRAPREEPEPS